MPNRPERLWMLMDVTELPPTADLPTSDAETRFFKGDIDDLMASTGWLTEDDLMVFLESYDQQTGLDNETVAAKMFKAFMRFNDRAATHSPGMSYEFREVVEDERVARGLSASPRYVTTRLTVNTETESIARASVIDLSLQLSAVACWVPDGKAEYARILRDWAISLEEKAAV